MLPARRAPARHAIVKLSLTPTHSARPGDDACDADTKVGPMSQTIAMLMRRAEKDKSLGIFPGSEKDIRAAEECDLRAATTSAVSPRAQSIPPPKKETVPPTSGLRRSSNKLPSIGDLDVSFEPTTVTARTDLEPVVRRTLGKPPPLPTVPSSTPPPPSSLAPVVMPFTAPLQTPLTPMPVSSFVPRRPSAADWLAPFTEKPRGRSAQRARWFWLEVAVGMGTFTVGVGLVLWWLFTT
jgi:hypothetical protein